MSIGVVVAGEDEIAGLGGAQEVDVGSDGGVEHAIVEAILQEGHELWLLRVGVQADPATSYLASSATTVGLAGAQSIDTRRAASAPAGEIAAGDLPRR